MSFTVRCLFCQAEYETSLQSRDCPRCAEPGRSRSYLPLRWLEARRRAKPPHFFACACGVVRAPQAAPCARCGAAEAPVRIEGRPAWVAVSLRWDCARCGPGRSRLDWVPREASDEASDEASGGGCSACHALFAREALYERLLYYLHGLIELSPPGEVGQVVLPLFSLGGADLAASPEEAWRDPPGVDDLTARRCLTARIFLGAGRCVSCGRLGSSSMCASCGHMLTRGPSELEDVWQEHRRLREAMARIMVLYLYVEAPTLWTADQVLYREESRAQEGEVWSWLLLQSEEPSRMRQRLAGRVKAGWWRRLWGFTFQRLPLKSL